MTVDPTVTFGDLIKIGAMLAMLVVGWFVFKQWMSVQLAEMRITMRNHAEMLRAATAKMEQYETSHTQLVAEVQRLVGQMEVLTQNMGGRRFGPSR